MRFTYIKITRTHTGSSFVLVAGFVTRRFKISQNNVELSVNYSGDGSNLPEALTSFIVYRIDPETREIGSTALFELFDSGVGADNVANDGIFTNVLAVCSDIAGESFGFHVVPVLNGVEDASLPFVTSSLNAVRSYLAASGIGGGVGDIISNITETSIEDLTLVIEYSWPADQPDLDTGTFFLGNGVGFRCSSSTDYIEFSGDNTSTGGIETARIRLGSSFAGGLWSLQVSVFLNAGWYSCSGQGPASVTVFTEKPSNDGSVIVGTAVSFAMDPGCQNACSNTLVERLDVQVDELGGNVVVAVLPAAVADTPSA